MIVTKRRFLVVVGVSISTYLFFIWIVLHHNSNDHDISDPDNNLPREQRTPSNAFYPERGDVFVFFHIQKSGGTIFNGHLINLDVKPPCDCHTDPPEEGSCRCRDAQGYTWLYSRFTTSSSCGVHPPLSELSECVPKFLQAAEGHDEHTRKRYLYLTLIRDPVMRYLSEWRHLQVVAPWPSNCHQIENPVQTCIDKAIKSLPLSLRDFLLCPANPANNRIVRMLTQDSGTLCDNIDTDANAALSHAKKTLESLAFFGITEEPMKTQLLFEGTFGVKFKDKFYVQNRTIAERTLHEDLNEELLNLVKDKNSLDIELYAYAKSLFYERFHNS